MTLSEARERLKNINTAISEPTVIDLNLTENLANLDIILPEWFDSVNKGDESKLRETLWLYSCNQYD